MSEVKDKRNPFKDAEWKKPTSEQIKRVTNAFKRMNNMFKYEMKKDSDSN